MAYSQLLRKYQRRHWSWFIFSLVLLVPACSSLDPQQADTKPVSHDLFDTLLAEYVDAEGLVDYEGLLARRDQLTAYLDLLTANPPNDKHWSAGDKLAYWINLYNAFTIDLILEHYPVASIKDIGASVQVPFVNTPWDIKMININGEKFDLNNIEHNILRKIFNEPRIHFAINCASMSCPKLRPEAYRADIIDRQLHEQAMDFINDPFRNDITTDAALISEIFRWWQGDFTKEVSLKEYLNRYALYPVEDDVEIFYKDYDWSLNKSSR